MDWVASIHQAIQYIEEHLREELTIREIAQQAALSPFYFQKGFAMLCGMTVGDYIRQRRLSAAGLEVLTTDRKDLSLTPSGVSGHFPSRYSSTHFLLYSYVYRIIIPPLLGVQ